MVFVATSAGDLGDPEQEMRPPSGDPAEHGCWVLIYPVTHLFEALLSSHPRFGIPNRANLVWDGASTM